MDFDNIVMREPVKHLSEQMCGANKHKGKMVLVLLREEWISLLGHGTFHRYVFMLSNRVVRTSGNGLSRKTWSHFIFAQHLEAYLINVRVCCTFWRYDNFFSLDWKLKNQSLKLIVITFCKKRSSCDRVIKRGPGNLSSQARS